MNNYTLGSTILYLDNVSIGYDNKPILKDINIIEKDVIRDGKQATGQVIAIVGRSGRGKSTLFKALTGLLKPLSGNVLITDLTTDDKTDAKIVKEGDIGFVDQKYTLFRHKTIQQICEFVLRKSKLTKQERHDKIIKYLTNWGLLEHKDKYSCELSGGQRQRTAIIEQILTDKHFIVFDEPTSGLDISAIETVKKSLIKIQEEHELNTIIFSTHNIEFAVEMADSIYVIGRPEGVTDYSTIVKHIDLKQLNIAWKNFGSEHIGLVNEIKQIMLKS